ncbi:MAG: hypothetical protein QOE72_3290, partial [Chloroflexota bacterium]|nr:hypothetical protein [Chloroflexota bacterium]
MNDLPEEGPPQAPLKRARAPKATTSAAEGRMTPKATTPAAEGRMTAERRVLFLTTADTELIAVAAARQRLPRGCAPVSGL